MLVMTLAEWCEVNNKAKLLELYDNDANDKSAFEISYSSGRPCWCKCLDCGRKWKTKPNKLIRLAEKKYNYYKKPNLRHIVLHVAEKNLPIFIT